MTNRFSGRRCAIGNVFYEHKEGGWTRVLLHRSQATDSFFNNFGLPKEALTVEIMLTPKVPSSKALAWRPLEDILVRVSKDPLLNAKAISGSLPTDVCLKMGKYLPPQIMDQVLDTSYVGGVDFIEYFRLTKGEFDIPVPISQLRRAVKKAPQLSRAEECLES